MRDCRRATSPLVVLLVLFLSPGASAQDEPLGPFTVDDALEAATQANEVNQVYCGEAYSANIQLAADATRRVVDVWSHVDEVYQDVEEPYLLFWRGVLAQCLGRPEAAAEDLRTFVQWQTDEGGYPDLVRQAEIRMRRLDRSRGTGTGPAARFLQENSVLELEIAYLGGIAPRFEICTDDPDPAEEGAYIAGRCIDNTATWRWATGGRPLGLSVGARFYPVKVIGLGVQFDLSVAPRPSVLNEGLTRTEVPWSLLAGPELRLQRDKSAGGRAVRLQFMPGLFVRHDRSTPWAGNQQELTAVLVDPEFLYAAGTWGWTSVGLGARLDLNIEVSAVTALRLGGRGGFGLNTANPTLTQVESPSDLVQNMPDPVELTTMTLGAHAGVLIVRSERAPAFAPTLRITYETQNLGYPHDISTFWYVNNSDSLHDSRRVYSVRRDELVIQLEVGIRLGVPRNK